MASSGGSELSPRDESIDMALAVRVIEPFALVPPLACTRTTGTPPQILPVVVE